MFYFDCIGEGASVLVRGNLACEAGYLPWGDKPSVVQTAAAQGMRTMKSYAGMNVQIALFSLSSPERVSAGMGLELVYAVFTRLSCNSVKTRKCVAMFDTARVVHS